MYNRGEMMGKGDRVRAIHAAEKPKEDIELKIIRQSDGKVTVSGPINDPRFVTNMITEGLIALAQYWAQQRNEQSRIVTPPTSLILPRSN
jgi:hypothetical protein